MFLIFILCLFSSFVCFALYFVCSMSVCFVMFLFLHIVVFLFVYEFTDRSRQVETQLQLINISYHVACRSRGTRLLCLVRVVLVM
jgi:hypothetical protein